VSLFLASAPVSAFEIQTHADISGAAFDLSSVSVSLQDLNIDPGKPLNGGLLRPSLPPRRWVQEGARDEDDTISTNFARYRNHFYDPVNDRGLSTLLASGERAPDWALEDRQQFVTQSFSYRDARQAFLTALTAPKAVDREAALARTFEALGHVIHVVQDMGSPPHTRNDIHGGFIIFGPTSLYERHLDQAQVRRRLNFAGTPVRFGLPREYWTTGDGRGLAEFVNRNFVSEGTNFRARLDGAIGGGYPSPVLRLGVDEQGRPFEVALNIQTQLERGLRDTRGNLVEGSVTFFANNFRDPITGEALRNERMTTLSLFDRELERKGASLLFTLNRYNVEAQAAFLIPRAVGYSAGLLDYFFRGKLDVDFVPGAVDRTQVELRVTNRSDDAIGPGTLSVRCDDANGTRTQLPAAVSLTAPVPKDADLPRVPFSPPKGTERCVLVYRGQLGNEVPVPNADPTLDVPGAVVGKVFAFGNLHNVDIGFDPVTFAPRLELWTAAQGDFALDLAPFGVPVFAFDVTAKFCQNNPTAALVTWQTFERDGPTTDGAPLTVRKVNFLVLKIASDQTVGKVSAAPGGPTPPRAVATLVTAGSAREDDFTSRTVNLAATLKHTSFFNKVKFELTGGLFRLELVDSRIHTTTQTFPATVRFIPSFGRGLDDRIFCVERGGRPEIFLGVEGDLRASDIYPFEAGRFGPAPFTAPGGFVTMQQEQFDLETETLVTRPVDFQFEFFARLAVTFPPLHFHNLLDATVRNGGPLLLLNLTTKQILARNVLPTYTISWVLHTPYSGGDKLVKINNKLDLGESVTTLPDDGVPPDVLGGGVEWDGTPNPFTHGPWVAESSAAASNLFVRSFKQTVRLQFNADPFSPGQGILTLNLPFSRGGFESHPGEGFFAAPEEFTRPRVAASQAFIGGDPAALKPLVGLTPGPDRTLGPGFAAQDQAESINEWTGAAFVKLFDRDPVGGPEVQILKSSRRWILLRERLSGRFRLVDRVLLTNRLISADSVERFDPTPDGTAWHMTGDRIYFVGQVGGRGLSLADRGLLRVSLDAASGEVKLAKTAEVPPPVEDTEFLGNLRGATSAVFPDSLNQTGNPTP